MSQSALLPAPMLETSRFSTAWICSFLLNWNWRKVELSFWLAMKILALRTVPCVLHQSPQCCPQIASMGSIGNIWNFWIYSCIFFFYRAMTRPFYNLSFFKQLIRSCSDPPPDLCDVCRSRPYNEVPLENSLPYWNAKAVFFFIGWVPRKSTKFTALV